MFFTTLSERYKKYIYKLYTEEYAYMNFFSIIRDYFFSNHEQEKTHKRKFNIITTILFVCIIFMSYNIGAKSVYAAVAIDQNNDDNYITIEQDSSLKVSYNDTTYNNSVFPGIRINDTWLVPVKEFLTDILGCTYTYDDNSKTLEITNNYGNMSVSATIGSSELKVGDSTITMDIPVMQARNSENESEETIYVPASKVIQNLGYGYISSSDELKISDNIYFYQKSEQTDYESQYSNAVNSIIYTKDTSGNDIVKITMLKSIDATSVSVKAENNTIEYTYNNSKNLLGNIDKSFTNSVVTSIKLWEENNNTHLKVVFDGKYVTSKSISENTFTLTLKKGSFSMKVLIPDGVNSNKITVTDRYWNKQFYILVPGNHVSFYKENRPINNSSAIKKIAVNKTSNGKTRIIVTTTKLRGYKITKKDGYFTVKVGSPKNIYKNIILLDAGHGGKDSGATHGKLYEKNLNLEILYTRARKYFESNSSNVKAYWTRHDDTFINLYTRPKLSKTYSADMFLSLHMNSAGNRLANGTEVYYSSNNNKVTNTGLCSKKMASMMLNSILDGVNSKNRGVRQAGFVVNKYNSVPSVLVELGFITGNKDYPNLKKAAYREKAAKALYDGVEKIFKKYPTKR